MKKTVLLLLTLIMLGGVVCHASVIPPEGPGQIGFSSVVLCNSLSLHSGPDYNSTTSQTLKYGDRIIVMSQSNGWAEVVLGDSEDSPSGWVDASYIAVDPAWYRTAGDTPVYAWDDTSAPRVALLDEGETLPILRDDGDWIIVSLRGATGWIHNPDRSGNAGNTGASQNNSSENSSFVGGVITVYDEFGEDYTLYEGMDGYWRDRSGTAYDRLSDTDFQAHEGTKRLSVYYPAQEDEDDGSVTVYDEYNNAYTLYEGADGIWRDRSGTEYLQVSDTEFQVKDGNKRLTTY